MFPATPPRLISRSPTRNDTEILSSFSAMSVSVNLPANIIRWSVAIDPVTAIRIVGGLYSAFVGLPAADQWKESPQAQEPVAFGLSIVKPCFSMVSTKSIVAPMRYGAGHLIGHHADAAELLDDVAVERALVEVELVLQARATARLHGHPQPQVIPALLGEQRADLGRGGLGEGDPLLRHFVLNGHL